MYNIWYRYSDTITRTSIILLIVVTLTILSILNYSVWIGSSKTKVVEYHINPSQISSEDNTFIPPDSTLPKNIEDIYTELNTSNLTPKIVKMNLQGDIIVVNRTVNDVKTTFYLEYSKTYDCTIVKTDLRIKDPIQIFYHYEYDSKDDFSSSVFDFLNSYQSDTDNKVHLDKNDDGTLNISIE